MNYYPVYIPTLNRYTHFKRCVESLARNTHADKTELVIGLDYPLEEKYVEGYLKIKSYIPTIKGFKKVTVFERTENYGPSKNSLDLRDYCFRHYDAVILTEDDNEFSPCFLDFMNKALEKYRDDNRVVSVCGCNNENLYNVPRHNVFFAPSGGAWGLALWRHKMFLNDLSEDYFENVVYSVKASWRVFRSFPSVFNMLISMVSQGKKWGDVMWTTYNVLNNKYQLTPSISMVRNWGVDGSGVNCGVDNSFSKQFILQDVTFDLDDIDVAVEKKVMRRMFFVHFSKNKLEALRQVASVIKSYVVFRIKNHCSK